MSRLLIAAVVGGLLLSTPTFFTTKAFYQRAALKEAARASKAEKEKAELDTALATARADLLTANTKLNAVLLEERDEEQNRIDILAGTLDTVSKRVSVCASKSDVRVTLAANGTVEAVRGEQSRDLAESLREFANACAVGATKDAIDHNKLVEWFNRLPKVLEAK